MPQTQRPSRCARLAPDTLHRILAPHSITHKRAQDSSLIMSWHLGLFALQACPPVYDAARRPLSMRRLHSAHLLKSPISHPLPHSNGALNHVLVTHSYDATLVHP